MGLISDAYVCTYVCEGLMIFGLAKCGFCISIIDHQVKNTLTFKITCLNYNT